MIDYEKGYKDGQKEMAKAILKRMDYYQNEDCLDPRDSYDCNAIDAYNNVRKFIKIHYMRDENND